MALDDPNKVDAVGIENETEKIILTILDECDWNEPHHHLLALQAKLNAYFDFVEEGQLSTAYPAAVGRDIVIDIITRYPLPSEGTQLLARAAEACKELRIEIRTRQMADGGTLV
jgi:hypothetical protein